MTIKFKKAYTVISERCVACARGGGSILSMTNVVAKNYCSPCTV